jgi:hypothetical protein
MGGNLGIRGRRLDAEYRECISPMLGVRYDCALGVCSAVKNQCESVPFTSNPLHMLHSPYFDC